MQSVAQDADDDIKTVFGKDTEIKGFASFDTKLTDFNEEKALFLGGHGGVILNKHIILGIGGYGMTTRNDFNGIIPGRKLDLYSGYGGLVFGYIIAPKEVIHITLPLLLGAGGIEVVDHHVANTIDDRGATVERSVYFVAEPSLQIEVNVTRFFRFAIGGGYRFVQGTDLKNNQVEDKDLTSWTANISFKLGKF
ncbi:hypothetical protein C900_04634 [Fulvivirga imtechensis AK7]|uniref:Outer membrane protein beta-barrel domain-containing protein n=2 Tax=Fulvivirga TaxID=396811 RepID=L8JR30_9BACT|nr:hypothetical protein C900_04634 [Fulvivirga imtechensis AK7]